MQGNYDFGVSSYYCRVKEAKVEEITRHGTNNEPRPVLMKLNDVQAQRKLLNEAKLLRNAKSEMHRNFYLAPDKTIKEGEVQGVTKETERVERNGSDRSYD